MFRSCFYLLPEGRLFIRKVNLPFPKGRVLQGDIAVALIGKRTLRLSPL